MKISKERIAKLKVQRLAREFASEVRGSNLAFRVPDEMLDKVPDGLTDFFRSELVNRHRLVQRPDFLWEERKY